jgi:hypothetical protein
MTEPKPAITTPRLLEDEPEVSYSAYRRWQECNFQEALLRLGPGVIPRAPKDRRPYLVGNVVHKLLNEWVIPHGLLATPGLIEDKFDYEASKPGMRFKSMDDRANLLAKTTGIMEALAPPLINLVQHATTLAIESEVKRRFPDSAGTGWFWMQGVLDLTVTLNDGRVVILDYKTAENVDRFQLLWYGAIWFLGGDAPPTTLAFLQPQGTGYKLTPVVTTRDELEHAAYDAARMATALKGASFPSNPGPYRCKLCRVRGSCADSAYHTTRGRPSVD